MSDYMFMLENHLSSEQGRMLNEIQAAAAEANMSLFLTGGALRDMLGGQPIRALDFTVEGNPLKIAKVVAAKTGAAIASTNELRKQVQLEFAGAHTSIGMAHTERYSKPGAKPQVQAATIHEDLRSRDFTINAIALSLSRASRGLLIDPTNGIGDLERHELRTVSNYALYDDPVRILRLIRLRARLGFTVDERTQSQYQNVREAGLETKIPPESLLEELHHIASEPDPSLVVAALDQEKLLGLFSPAFTGPKVNVAGLQKLQKAVQMIPFGTHQHLDTFALFMHVFAEKLTPKERSALVAATAMPKSDVDRWQKLEGRVKKLESTVKSARLSKPSQVYRALLDAPGEEILFLLTHSPVRLVQDRIRNYLQKYLPAALEVTEREVEAAAPGLAPDSPKYRKIREQLITTRLDSRPKKVVTPEEQQPGAPGVEGAPAPASPAAAPPPAAVVATARK